MMQIAKDGDDLFDGVRLEACRALLNIHNGDILRMASNSLHETSSSVASLRMQSRRVFTGDFPVANKAVFLNSTIKLYDFLMADFKRPSNRTVFYTCMSKEEAVNKAMVAAYSSIPTVRN
mgnify:CR=1 FL=1